MEKLKGVGLEEDSGLAEKLKIKELKGVGGTRLLHVRRDGVFRGRGTRYQDGTAHGRRRGGGFG